MNPAQIQLCQIDPIALLAQILPDHTLPIIDGGANTGDTAAALHRHFPRAPIHCFEPVSQAHDTLAQRAAALPNTHPHKLALGDHEHAATININQNLWTCSILHASDRGHAFHGDWCRTIATETVRVTTIDHWARQHDIHACSIIKLDLQGYELHALRGAANLLPHTHAVYAEAQITPEYEGAATLTDIDLFMRDAGFGLYQIIDLCLKGPHAEPSCCDAIWLRNDILRHTRAAPCPPAIAAAHDIRSQRMHRALTLAQDHALHRVAIYGAGAHTAACGQALAATSATIVAIIDDARAGQSLWGYPIHTPARAVQLRPDAVILSSDRAEPALIQRAHAFLNAGIPVITLYQHHEPRIITPTTTAVARSA